MPAARAASRAPLEAYSIRVATVVTPLVSSNVIVMTAELTGELYRALLTAYCQETVRIPEIPELPAGKPHAPRRPLVSNRRVPQGAPRGRHRGGACRGDGHRGSHDLPRCGRSAVLGCPHRWRSGESATAASGWGWLGSRGKKIWGAVYAAGVSVFTRRVPFRIGCWSKNGLVKKWAGQKMRTVAKLLLRSGYAVAVAMRWQWLCGGSGYAVAVAMRWRYFLTLQFFDHFSVLLSQSVAQSDDARPLRCTPGACRSDVELLISRYAQPASRA